MDCVKEYLKYLIILDKKNLELSWETNTLFWPELEIEARINHHITIDDLKGIIP
jgi:hypothetical protein